MSIDLDTVVAIDVHTHAHRKEGGTEDPVTAEFLAAAGRYFGGSPPQPTAQEVADYYRERNMLAVVFTVDDEAGMGRKRLGNDEVLKAAQANPDTLIPFASVDPHKGKLADPRSQRTHPSRRQRLQIPPQHPSLLAQPPRPLPPL